MENRTVIEMTEVGIGWRSGRQISARVLSLFLLVATGSSAGAGDNESDASDFDTVFYVATDGDDANAGTREEPFATLERGRNAVRAIKTQAQGDILVEIAPGDYYRREPFLLGVEDSGENGNRVIYRGGGVPGAARFIGGTRVINWEPMKGGIFRARIEPGRQFHTLYENGIRARKARFPNYEFEERYPLSGTRYLKATEGTDTVLTWREGDLFAIRDVPIGKEANLVFWPWGYADWHKVTRAIQSVNFEKRTITIPGHKGSPAIGPQARFYLEGALDLLDQPGEFHFDSAANMLYYWPRFGHPGKQEIIVPTLKRIVSVEGANVDNPVRAVNIEGLTLGYTDTFATMVGPTLFPWSPSTSYGAHGIVHLRYTEEVEVLFNHIRSAGLNGIYLDRSNKRNRIYGNWIEDMGISGICLAYHRERRQFSDDRNEFNLVENNLIHQLGAIGVDSFGINIWGASDNTIAHCEVFDGARYAVTIRGPFVQRTFADTNRPFTKNNTVRHSHFYRLGQDSGDMGAVHMAATSTPDYRPINTLEQLLIGEVRAHPSMNDVKPNGIFFDYPEGVTDQVLRDIEIRTTEVPYRTNNTDLRHVYDNVSWREGFDASRMEYEGIGLKDDFPDRFRAPGEVRDVSVRQDDDGGRRMLRLNWNDPEDADLKGVWISAEGVGDFEPAFATAGTETVRLPRPATERLAMFRLRSEDRHGNLSQGILVSAAERPEPVTGLAAVGIEDGIQLTWQSSAATVGRFQIAATDPAVEPIAVPADARSAVLPGLKNATVYAVRVNIIDSDGHRWDGPGVKAAAGVGVPVPLDAAAWWTFDESAIRAGLSIGDASGNGNTLFVGNDKVELADGKFGKALRFDGKTAFARVLAPEPLAIGTGDYAVSLWIRQKMTVNHTERVFDFGGTGHPGLAIMANNSDVRLLFTAGETRYGPFYRGLEMVGEWMHVVVNIDRDRMLDLYVNGEKLASEDIAASAVVDISPAGYLHFGRFKDQTDSKYNWPGDIDQVRIFKRTLTSAEIISLYAEQ